MYNMNAVMCLLLGTELSTIPVISSLKVEKVEKRLTSKLEHVASTATSSHNCLLVAVQCGQRGKPYSHLSVAHTLQLFGLKAACHVNDKNGLEWLYRIYPIFGHSHNCVQGSLEVGRLHKPKFM